MNVKRRIAKLFLGFQLKSAGVRQGDVIVDETNNRGKELCRYVRVEERDRERLHYMRERSAVPLLRQLFSVKWPWPNSCLLFCGLRATQFVSDLNKEMSESVEAASSSSEPLEITETTEKEEEFIEPDKKRRKVEKKLNRNDKLEHRLGGILCCAVCLDLPRAAIYQVFIVHTRRNILF